jgi:hypothetical protein
MSNVIPHNWDVPQVFRGRFGAQAGRQRVMHSEGHLIIVLHQVPRAEDPGERTARLFWRKPDGTWKSSGSGATNIAALRAHVEKATRAAEWFGVLHASAPLLRTMRNMSAVLQEARDLAKTDRDLIGVRDTAQDLERAIELIHGHARSGLDYSIAKSAEDSAEHTKHVHETGHRLNLIAATFLPITALGALLSMNLRHGFEGVESPALFWAVAGAAFLFGLLIRASLPKAKTDP